jgi:hypothetical protein
VISIKARGKKQHGCYANLSFTPVQSDQIRRQHRSAEIETMMIGVWRDQPFSYSAFRAIQQGVDANLGGHALST